MLAEMIDKIVELKETQTFEINGEVYADKQLIRVKPHVDRPTSISVSTLSGICKLIRSELPKLATTIIVHATSYKTVDVFTTFADDMSRDAVYHAEANVPGFNGGWRDREEALIQLRSLFIPGDDTEYLLNLLSRISDDSTVKSTDNGVTQTVEARHGISLNAMVEIRPRVNLQPFRTFLEVPQPESEFILRLSQDRDIGLFEADGGVWKLEAKQNIVKYFERELEDLIESGMVLVI